MLHHLGQGQALESQALERRRRLVVLGDDGDADGHCEKDVKKLAQISHSPHYSASESLDPAAQNSKSNGLDSGGGWPEKETLGDPGAALAVP